MKTLYKGIAWTVGVLAVLALLVAVVTAFQKSHKKAVAEKTDVLYLALAKGSSDHSIYGNDSFFDGNKMTAVKASFDGTIEDARNNIVKHVEAAGYHVKCPATNPKLDFNEAGQEIKVDARDKCSLSGKGVAGTIRFYNRFEVTHLEAIFEF